MSESLKPEDTRDALRKIGGLLLGIGALMIYVRKTQSVGHWDDFWLVLVVGLPAAFLYGFGVRTVRDTGGVRPWQAVFSVFGLILIPIALSRFVDLLGGSHGADLNVFWIFAVTAGLALYAGLVAGIRFQLLAATIAGIVAWTALWDKVLGDQGIGGHIGTYRGLLGIYAIAVLVAGVAVWRAQSDEEEGRRRFSEFFTGAGIAAVLGCSLGASSYLNLFPIPLAGGSPIGTNLFWDALLLVISIGLVGIGANLGLRGPVYVGSVGLFLFLIIAGYDLDENPPRPDKLGIWPIVLVIAGIGAIAASMSEGVSLGDRPKQWVRRISGR
jgi:hypothetical protein